MIESTGNEFLYVVKLATGLISIVNPIGAIPRFLTFAEGRPVGEMKKLAFKTTVAMVLALLLASVAGEWILIFFGITLPSFQIGGGILVLLIAISMLHASPTRAKYSLEETQEGLEKEDFTVVPMAIPFLAGPGAFSTVILDSHQGQLMWQRVALWAMILLTGAVVYVSLRLAEPIRNKIGQTGVNIATRLMGLILAALAIEFITRGLGQTFPGLMGMK
jgi:multiple antibiotic resistance protein